MIITISCHKERRGLALAEYLIVLVLLAVIVAVTVPDYLTAKTRSNVGKVHADLRRIETAMVSYRLDNDRWMPDMHEYVVYMVPSISVSGYDDPYIYAKLTTPVAYLDPIPHDLLKSISQKSHCYSFYGNGWHKAVNDAGPAYSQDKFLGHWLLHSPGPDRVHDYGEWIVYIPERDAYGGASPREYDPSNGIVSHGDIVRWDNMERSLAYQ